MSKAKWFAVRKPSTGEIIATSASQIVPSKFRGPTKMLYYGFLIDLVGFGLVQSNSTRAMQNTV